MVPVWCVGCSAQGHSQEIAADSVPQGGWDRRARALRPVPPERWCASGKQPVLHTTVRCCAGIVFAETGA
ncbi:hypothetical protein GCM10010298_06470 [Streptomyces microflavus]|nr:hypothetical protein GCM10010298_06470 [Streptomyces microflavus]